MTLLGFAVGLVLGFGLAVSMSSRWERRNLARMRRVAVAIDRQRLDLLSEVGVLVPSPHVREAIARIVEQSRVTHAEIEAEACAVLGDEP